MLEYKVEEVSGLLKSISHPSRLMILCLLRDGEMTVGDIQARFETSTANISQHLTILRNQGIVGTRKEANFIYNFIADQRLLELMNTMQKLFC